ncbi:MAG: hypothetical protein ABFD18_13405 [Syntrophomonas sp.]
MNESIINLVLCFFIYAFLGWVLESGFKSIRDLHLVNSGFLYGPFVPVYGFAAITLVLFWRFLFLVLSPLSLTGSILIMLISIIAISSLWEYATGALLERFFHRQWWDYSNERFHIKGRVSLKYSLFWCLLGFFIMRLIHPLFVLQLKQIPLTLKYSLVLLLAVYLLIDIVKCLKTLGKLPLTDAFYSFSIFKKYLDRSKPMPAIPNADQTESSDGHCNFAQCIDDLIYHPLIQKMKQYRHHYSTSCYNHSLNVSYTSYRICKILGWDYRSAARAGMLHDLFLYDWRTTTLDSGRHGFIHPQIALENAFSVCALNNLEKDIILKHMFPLTWRPPSYKESLLVCLVDKYWAVKELSALGIFSERYAKSRHIPFSELAG